MKCLFERTLFKWTLGVALTFKLVSLTLLFCLQLYIWFYIWLLSFVSSLTGAGLLNSLLFYIKNRKPFLRFRYTNRRLILVDAFVVFGNWNPPNQKNGYSCPFRCARRRFGLPKPERYAQDQQHHFAVRFVIHCREVNYIQFL